MAMKRQQIILLILGVLIGTPVVAMSLHEAVSQGDSEKVRQLLTPDLEINELDDTGSTALQIAVRASNLEMSELLLSSGADVNAGKTLLGLSPLHIAARRSVELAKLLVDHGAEINSKDRDGTSPLHVAVRTGNSEMVKLLIAHGADVNSQDSEDYTPLHNAAWNGHIGTVELLVSNGADINAVTYNGRTPYTCAVKKNRDDVSAFLQKLGAYSITQ